MGIVVRLLLSTANVLNYSHNLGFGDSCIYKTDPKGNRHELSKSKQRRCKICHKIRRKSCSICDVGLCQEECFHRFHEDFASYNIYVEKYKCFGKNHRARINNLPYSYHKLLQQCGTSSASFQVFDVEKLVTAVAPDPGASIVHQTINESHEPEQEQSNSGHAFGYIKYDLTSVTKNIGSPDDQTNSSVLTPKPELISPELITDPNLLESDQFKSS